MSDERTAINDMDDTSRYDFRYDESDTDFYKVRKGLDEEVVRRISE